MPDAVDRPRLSHTEAVRRASRLSEVRYDIAVELTRGSERYAGRTLIAFELADCHEDLWLDFDGGELEALLVNGQPASGATIEGGRVRLRPSQLMKGPNRLELRYRNSFNKDGAGFQQVSDPEDGEEYCFTSMEPFAANRLFPCFDQPDLKARFRLSVEAPAAWLVVANAPIAAVEELPRGRRRHVAEETQLFSTYLFAVCAGPFASWDDPLARIPSRLFSTRSMARYVDADELFAITRAGFDFFESYFDIPYPFRKYDQVFVPQGGGAMENVGCVVHDDGFIFRHSPRESELEGRAETMLHELAHMWFGDLVTMRWWNDLWLKESFASYMAVRALVAGGRFTRAWEGFHADMKEWAYWQDQMPTTHAIDTPVPDTETTYSNFDGITYGKGAAVLKQLVFRLGDDVFRRAVSAFLKHFAWGNAERRDFFGFLERESGEDLGRWQELWIQRSGLNAITPRLVGTDAIELEQSAGNGDAVLRPHRLGVAIYRRTPAGVVLARVASVELDGASARVPLDSAEPPLFIFANHDDQAYARVLLDRASRRVLAAHLDELPDPFVRSSAWQALWLMLRDVRIPASEYLDLFLAQAGSEQDAHVLEAADELLPPILDRFLPRPDRTGYVSRIAELAWSALEARPPAERAKIWFGRAVACSEAAPQLARLAALLGGALEIHGIELDQEKRWRVITQLVAMGHAEPDRLIEAEERSDATDRGRRLAFRARASVPDAATKEATWQRCCSDEASNLDLLKSGMDGFWWVAQLELLGPWVERFFNELAAVERRGGRYLSEAVMRRLYPLAAVSPETVRLTTELLEREPGLSPPVRRRLVECRDEVARALRAREVPRDAP